jgi:hypothetical protein
LSLDPEALKTALVKCITSKERVNGIKDINAAMLKDPGKDYYRINYDDGSWIQATGKLTRLDTPAQAGVSTNGYSESIQGYGAVYQNGNWQLTYELDEFSGASYSKNSITAKWTQSGLGGGTPTAQFYSREGGQSYAGVISISNVQTYYTPDNGTAVNTATADAVNQVVFH